MKNKEFNNDLLARYAIFLAANKMGVSIEDNKLTEEEKSLVQKQISNDTDLLEYIHFLQNSYIQLYQDLDKSDLGNITLKARSELAKMFLRRIKS